MRRLTNSWRTLTGVSTGTERAHDQVADSVEAMHWRRLWCGTGRGCTSDSSGWRDFVWLGTVTAEMVRMGHVRSSESAANDDSL